MVIVRCIKWAIWTDIEEIVLHMLNFYIVREIKIFYCLEKLLN